MSSYMMYLYNQQNSQVFLIVVKNTRQVFIKLLCCLWCLLFNGILQFILHRSIIGHSIYVVYIYMLILFVDKEYNTQTIHCLPSYLNIACQLNTCAQKDRCTHRCIYAVKVSMVWCVMGCTWLHFRSMMMLT